MFRCYRSVLFLVFATVILREAESADRLVGVYAMQEIGEAVTRLDRWLVYGPFVTDPDTDVAASSASWNVGSLPFSGTHDEGDLAAIARRKAGPSGTLCLKREMLDFFSIFHIDKASGPKPSYLTTCDVVARRDMDVWILLASDGVLEVSVNGNVVGRNISRRSIYFKYGASVPARLRSGANTITIKIVRPTGSCGLSVAVCDTASSAFHAILDADNAILERLMIGKEERPVFNTAGEPPGVQSNRVVNQLYASSMAGEESTGLYEAVLTTHRKTYRERFIVGDARTLFSRLCAQIRSEGELPEQAELSMAALQTRMETLFTGEHLKPNREWQRKVVLLIDCAFKMSKAGGASRNHPLRNQTGFSIRGFRASTDGGVRHYRLYVPEEFADGKARVPLAIMLPTSMSATRPFLTSVFMARQFEADRMAQLASEYGVALLWCGYPCQPYGNAQEMSHLEDVLSDLHVTHNIDPTRIFLLGTCSAAVTAVLTGSHAPDRYAAIGLLDPISDRVRNGVDDSGEYALFPAYRTWIQMRNPLTRLKDLKSVALCLVYDGPAPGHGSREELRRLASAAEASGVTVSMDEVSSSNSHLIGWDAVLRMVTAHRRRDWDGKGFSRRVQQHGGIYDAFARPFVFVRGTNCAPHQQKAIDALIQAAVENWERVHFARPPVVNDVEVRQVGSFKNYSWVVFGNQNTNECWKNLQPNINFVDCSVGGTHSFDKGSTVIARMYLAAEDRHVVFIGAEDVTQARLGAFNVSTHGWFDFAAWSRLSREGKPQLIKALRYSSDASL